MNDALYILPLLCRAVEDGYGKSRGLSWWVVLIVSKLELGPPMSESSSRILMVVLDALRKPSFL
jgi:hypothetical protein